MTIGSLRCAVAAAPWALLPAGCGTSPELTPDEAFSPNPVVLDGSIHEWPQEEVLLADGKYIYFRASAFDGTEALQAAPQSLAIWFDLDDSAQTGLRRSVPRAAFDLGIDLEIIFSPPGPDGSPGVGVVVNAVDRAGGRKAIPHAAIDFMFLPTYAATWQEGRFLRSIFDRPELAEVRESGSFSAMLVVLDRGAPTNSWSYPSSAKMPARSDDESGAFALVPTRSMQTVRIMTWNVLRSSPVNNAAPFARIVGAIKPDIILLQEWDYTAPQLSGWFTALIDARGWNALALELHGVSIVTGFPLEPLGEPILLDGNETRFVAGIASTPIGPMCIGSTHLTCCGAAGDERDQRRQLEAGAINAWVASWLEGAGVTMRVIGGDMNLVGSRAPLDMLVGSLGDDAEDLPIAEAYVLGDAAQYTWTDAGQPFTPGRLDYIAAGGSELEIVRAFALDTRRLSDAALARMGLERSDSGATDHLPLVVDVRRK